MTNKRELYLVEHLKRLPDDGTVFELLSGEIIGREAPSETHAKVVDRLADALTQHVDESDLGAVFRMPWPVELSKYDLVKPDIYFVAWKDGVMEVDGVRGTPEFVIEVLSPESSPFDLGEKKRLYAWAGVFEYWVVDPESKSIQPMKKVTQGYQLIEFEGSRLQSYVLPDFAIDLQWLFAELDLGVGEGR